MHITGPKNGAPCKVGVALTDVCTGLYAHGAIMAALIERGKTGKGQKIECDLLSTQVSTLVRMGPNFVLESCLLKTCTSKSETHETSIPR